MGALDFRTWHLTVQLTHGQEMHASAAAGSTKFKPDSQSSEEFYDVADRTSFR